MMNQLQNEETNPYKERRAKRRIEKHKPYIIGGAVLLVILLCIFVSVTVSGSGIRKGVSINGLSVSGMSKAEAEKKLNKHLKDVNFTVTFDFNDAQAEFSSADLITEYKIKKAVENAYELGRNKNIISNFFKTLSLKINGKTSMPSLNLTRLCSPNISTTFLSRSKTR